jgi:glycosyltransferase involved in cell wall biosynthesis
VSNVTDSQKSSGDLAVRQRPLVSVIIPTRNSAATLRRCIDSVREQTYTPIEVIVVDNHSTDGTPELAAELADVAITAGNERSAQTNAGVRAAKGEWIYRVDSDFIVESDVVSEAITTALTQGCDAILVHNESDPSVSRWARARAFERAMYRDDDTNVATRFLKKALFERVGGFDESLIAGEDYDLHLRVLDAGARMGRINASELHLGEPRSLREVIEKHFFYGREMRRYTAKHGKKTVTQLSPVRPAFLSSWRTLLRHPLRTSEMAVYLVVKYIAGGAGFVLGPKQKEQ